MGNNIYDRIIKGENMRLPLNSIFITNKHGTPGYGYFGKHAGWDLRAAIDTKVYAKREGTVTEKYVGSAGIKVLSVRYPDYEHRYLHLSFFAKGLNVGSKVSEGQIIAYTGNTGNVAAHLHEDIRKIGTSWTSSYNNYIDPEVHYKSLLNPSNPPQGGEMANRAQVNNLYKAILHRDGDEGGLNTYTGQDANTVVSAMLNSQEFKNHQNYLNVVTKQVQDLQTALANEQNKPPKVIEKEVEKIVEKIVKVEVPVEVIKEVEPSWLKATVDFIRKVLRIS